MSTYNEALSSISLDADDSLAQYTGFPGMPGSASPNYGHQYSFVKITGPHTVGLCGAGDKPHGVVQNKPQKVGSPATVGFLGVSDMIAGTGGFQPGDRLKSDANGHAVHAADNENAYATAIDAAAAGSAGPVLLGRC